MCSCTEGKKQEAHPTGKGDSQEQLGNKNVDIFNGDISYAHTEAHAFITVTAAPLQYKCIESI